MGGVADGRPALLVCGGGAVKKVRCPVCGRTADVGKIGPRHWYCAACAVEFREYGGSVRLYALTPTGEQRRLETGVSPTRAEVR